MLKPMGTDVAIILTIFFLLIMTLPVGIIGVLEVEEPAFCLVYLSFSFGAGIIWCAVNQETVKLLIERGLHPPSRLRELELPGERCWPLITFVIAVQLAALILDLVMLARAEYSPKWFLISLVLLPFAYAANVVLFVLWRKLRREMIGYTDARLLRLEKLTQLLLVPVILSMLVTLLGEFF